MVRLFISLLILSVIAFCAWGVIHIDRTYVLILDPIRPGEDKIEPSAGLVAAALAGALALALMGGRIWQFFAALPGRIRERSAAHRKERGYVALTKGLAAVAAGDAKESASLAKTSKSLLRDQRLTALLSAQSAQLQGKEDVATDEFKLLLRDEETAFLGLRGLAMQALRQDREVEALRHVRAAYALRPTAPWVLELLALLELREGNVLASIDALETSRKHGHLDISDAKDRLAPLYTHLAQDELAAGNTQAAVQNATKALDQDPLYLPAALIGARALIDTGDLAQARTYIAKQWAKSPHPDFPDLYLEASETGTDPQKMRRSGLKLFKNNDGSQAMQLALGELMLKCLDMEAAAPALEAAKAQGSKRAAELRDLLPRLTNILDDSEAGENAASRQERARALIEAALAGPQEWEWTCTNCAATHAAWQFRCHACDQTGTIQWQDQGHPRATRPKKQTLAGPRLLSGLN